MSRWFRFYDEVLDDPKVQRLHDHQFKAWVNLLCLASRNDGKLPAKGIIAFALRTEIQQVDMLLVFFTNAGLLDQYEEQFWPHNWKKRQYKSDVTDPTAAERMRRKRNKDRNEDRNTTVTVLPPDTEAETDKKEIDSASARSPKIRPEAFSLSNDCLLHFGIDPVDPPPEWCGLPWQIEMMLARGYDPPNVLGVAVRHGAHRPLKPMNYFVKCVESSQQNQIKPAGVPNAKSGNVVEAADRLLAKLAYFDEPAPESARVCGGTGETPLRSISQR